MSGLDFSDDPLVAALDLLKCRLDSDWRNVTHYRLTSRNHANSTEINRLAHEVGLVGSPEACDLLLYEDIREVCLRRPNGDVLRISRRDQNPMPKIQEAGLAVEQWRQRRIKMLNEENHPGSKAALQPAEAEGTPTRSHVAHSTDFFSVRWFCTGSAEL